MTVAGEPGPELVVHLFDTVDGPQAGPAYAELLAVWERGRAALGLTLPFLRSGIDAVPPPSVTDLPAARPGRQVELAAAKHPESMYQAILRQVDHFLVLSFVLAPGPVADWSGLAARGEDILGPGPSTFLGAARLFVDYTGEPTAVDTAQPMADRLPVAGIGRWWWDHCVLANGIGLWEPGLRADPGRQRRDFLVLGTPHQEAEVSALIWSDGTSELPPLARYLLYAATVRHHVRLWQHAGHLSRTGDESGATGVKALRREIADYADALTRVRVSVERASTNLTTIIGPLVGDVVAGPIAHDTEVARWITTAVDDELADLDALTNRLGALESGGLEREDDEPMAQPPATDGRRVLVVHGRDEQVRVAFFEFLQALDLRPLEWEELVEPTAAGTPFLGEVLNHALNVVQAAVVLLTPDDGAVLHESMRNRSEEAYETVLTGQARPNVLFEAGMAMGRFPDRTIVIEIGRLRPFADMVGRNVIRFEPSVETLNKVVQRLRNAGCAPNTTGNRWLELRRFVDLDAFTRHFPDRSASQLREHNGDLRGP